MKKFRLAIPLFLFCILCLFAACGEPSATEENKGNEEHEHNFSAWETVVFPTCEKGGVQERSCPCGETERKDLSSLGHDFDENFTVDVPSTCLKTGSKSRHCRREGCEKRTEETSLPLSEHSFSEWTVISQPTCLKGGEEESSCNVCGKEQKRSLSALGHQIPPGSDVSSEATCERGGKGSFTCERCHVAFGSETPALGHDFETEFSVEKLPGCTETGLEIRKCRRCRKIAEERLIQPTNHNWVLEKTEDGPSPCGGKVMTYVCNNCGKSRCETSQGEHAFGAFQADSPSFCTVGPWKTKTCSVCGIKDTRYFAELKHSWGEEYTVGREPTEEEDGYRYLTCTRCGAEKPDSRVFIPRYTIGQDTNFEVRVKRTFGRPFQSEATVSVYDGDKLVDSCKTFSQIAKFTLPAKDYTLKLSDLPNGYTPYEENFVLRPGEPNADIWAKGSFLGGKMPEGYKYQVGDALYDLEFTSYDEKVYSVRELLTDYKAILFNFYFTTCGYCNEEFPNLIKAQQKYGNEVLVVYVNGHEEDRETVEQHAKKVGIDGSILAKYFLIDDFPKSKNKAEWGFPTTVIVDCEGTIAERYNGILYGDFFETLMQKYIGYADQSGWKKQGMGQIFPFREALLPERKRF